MHYYQFNIGDYASHTRGLSLLEDLAYRRLIDEYYLAERALNGCSTDVARLIGFVQHEAEVAYILKRFFVEKDGTWVHERIENEIAEFKDKQKKNAKAGKASAAARKNKGVRTDAQHPFNGRSTDVQPTKNQEPITNNQEPLENTGAQGAPVVASDDVVLVFEFWKTAMKSPRSQLDSKRAKLIKAALKTGYTVEQLCDAITGCAKSPFHMGDNDRRAKYNGLDLILRNAEKIDQFIVIGQSPLVPKRQGFTHDLSGMDYSKGVDEHGNF